MSVLMRDREREWDTRSSAGPRGKTTVRRYVIPDILDDKDRAEEKKLVVRRRESEPESETPRSTIRYRIVEREREPEPEPEREQEQRSYRYERSSHRAPSPPEVRGYRFRRDYHREADYEPEREPYEVERYVRSTDYYAPPAPDPPQTQPIVIRQEAPQAPPPPQPIIIRQEHSPHPVVIREEPRYEIVNNYNAPHEERQVAQRQPRYEDEYYYRRYERDESYPDDYYSDEPEHRYGGRAEGAGVGAVAAYGAAGGRDEDDRESYYYRRERSESGGSDESHHKRHLAEGALAGIGAAALVHHHQKRQGETPEHRGAHYAGAAVAGVAGAEALHRAKDRGMIPFVDGDRSSSSSREREGRSKHRHHHRRHHSRSHSRAKKLAAVGAVAAVGALAYAAGKKNNSGDDDRDVRRSRSRRRRHSVGALSRGRSRTKSRHRDSSHQNNHVAKAGLAGATAAGIIKKVRSRSRGKSRDSSRSRLKTGVPIVAAGVTSAAAAGLYDKAMAKKEERRSRSRSRSRSVTRSPHHHHHHHRHRKPRHRGSFDDDNALIEYGGEPIRADHRAREPRNRSSSSSSSGRSGSKSKVRKAAETVGIAGAVGAAGLAAREAGKHHAHKEDRDDEERRHYDDDERHSDTDGQFDQHHHNREEHPSPGDEPMSPLPSTPSSSTRYYPETNEFPPPPGEPYNPPDAENPYPQPPHQVQEPAPYNPADYAGLAPTRPQPEQYTPVDYNTGAPAEPSQDYFPDQSQPYSYESGPAPGIEQGPGPFSPAAYHAGFQPNMQPDDQAGPSPPNAINYQSDRPVLTQPAYAVEVTPYPPVDNMPTAPYEYTREGNYDEDDARGQDDDEGVAEDYYRQPDGNVSAPFMSEHYPPEHLKRSDPSPRTLDKARATRPINKAYRQESEEYVVASQANPRSPNQQPRLRPKAGDRVSSNENMVGTEKTASRSKSLPSSPHRARKAVQFDLQPQELGSDKPSKGFREQKPKANTDENENVEQGYESDSDSTIELPGRFDEYGRPKRSNDWVEEDDSRTSERPGDGLVYVIEDLFSDFGGSGIVGSTGWRGRRKSWGF